MSAINFYIVAFIFAIFASDCFKSSESADQPTSVAPGSSDNPENIPTPSFVTTEQMLEPNEDPIEQISGNEAEASHTRFISVNGEELFAIEKNLSNDIFVTTLRGCLKEKSFSEEIAKLIVDGDSIDIDRLDEASLAIIRASNSPITIVRIFICVRKVCIRSGDLIDEIKFVMSDGSEKIYGVDENGIPGGAEKEEFCLEAEELLTTIQCREGDLLDAVRFCTDNGRYSDWYGNILGGDLKAPVQAPANHMIIGLNREAGYCRLIQNAIFAPTQST